MRIKSITIIPLAIVLCLLNNAEALRGSGLHRDESRKLAKKAKGEHKHGMMRVVKAAKKAAKMILEEEVDDEEESFVVNIEEEFKPHGKFLFFLCSFFHLILTKGHPTNTHYIMYHFLSSPHPW